MKFVEKFADSVLVCFAAGVLGVGCSSATTDEPASPADPNDAPVEIVLNGGVSVSASAVVGRAAAPDTRLVVNAAHKALPITILRLDQGADGNYPAFTDDSVLPAVLEAINVTFEEDGTYKSISGIKFGPLSDDNTVAENPQYYLANGNKTKLIGWYPQKQKSGADAALQDVAFNATAGTVTFQIDGASDIMVCKQFVEGSKTEPINNTKVLAFEHQLTQIQVSAYAENAAANQVWGGIKNVAIKDQNNQCEFTLPKPDVESNVKYKGTPSNLSLIKKSIDDETVIAGATNALAEYGESNALTLPVKTETEAAQSLGYAMFEPVLASLSTGDEPAKGNITLVITTEKATIEKAVEMTGGFKQGHAYTITLKFTATGVAPYGSITSWVNAAEKPEIVL